MQWYPLMSEVFQGWDTAFHYTSQLGPCGFSPAAALRATCEDPLLMTLTPFHIWKGCFEVLSPIASYI